MSNTLILYNLDLSPPVRAVKVVAKILGLELELRDLNLFEGEHLKEPFISLNPEHTVPTLVDGDFAIWDSHTIVAYLVDKYAKNDQLYPKDLQLRARCNQRLFFDASSLFVRLRDCGIPIYFQGCTAVPQEKIDAINTSYELLEAFLATDPYLVGQKYTIADICTVLTVQFLEVFAPLQADKHPKILAWLQRVDEQIPHFKEINGTQKEQYRQLIADTLEKNKQQKQ